MNVLNRTLPLIATVALLNGCATNTKEKIVRNTLIAGAIGASYGSSKDEFQSQHGLMYGASAAVVAAIASVYYYDPDRELENMRKTTAQLRDEMEEFENGSNLNGRSTITKGLAVEGYEKLPQKYRNMINPGKWVLFEIDQWVDGGEGRLIHQDKMLELKPATLKAR